MKSGVIALALFMLVAAGCASTPQATVERDQDAKTFPSHPATSAIYVYRTGNYHGNGSDDSTLWVDNRLIGATLPNTYFVIHVDPGKHVLTGLAADNGRLTLETRPGELVFVALRVINGQSHFQRVSPEVGQESVLNCCALLENWAPGQRPLLR